MNRSNVVLVVLSLMLAGLVFSLVTRPREAHTAPKVPIVVERENPRPKPSASASSSTIATEPPPPKKTRLFDRPLAVSSLGWHLIAPGVVQNGGLEARPGGEFSKAGLEVRLATRDTMKQIESALARGGSDEKGIDVAIVPLPEFTASYEALKALDPVIFLTVGWSHGQDLVAGQIESLAELPKKGPYRVNGLGGSSSLFLAAFTLETRGIPLEEVELEPPNAEQPSAPIWALRRADLGAAPEAVQRHQLLSTAEAVHLIPYVAVAQRSLVENHVDALVTWASLWLRGEERVSEDATRAARELAKLKGGPEPLELLADLGRVTNSSVSDNARAIGAAGRGAVTLGSLFARVWEAWRALKVLSTPAPERTPVTGQVVAPLALESGREASKRQDEPKPPASDADEKPLLAIDPGPGKLDETAFIQQAGFFAGVFARSTVIVSVYSHSLYDEKLTNSIAERTRERFDIRDSRLVSRAIKPTSLSPYLLLVMPVR